MSKIEPINVMNKFSLFDEKWTPKIIGELNSQYVKVCKLQDDFVWHSHENEDELFWVVEGCLEIHLRAKVVELHPGELLVVPRGVEHKPVAKSECQVVLFEPAGTLNTGNIVNERTVTKPQVI